MQLTKAYLYAAYKNKGTDKITLCYVYVCLFTFLLARVDRRSQVM